ncbi:metal-dependent hydrolase [Methanomethylovorans sp.]|uniref:metal-dependent hydrolase n=1 Tax=Methanomethylovorans sp. TaxID=2758717 RepID=UPI00351CB3E7
MFVFGHLGITLGLFTLLEHKLPALKGRVDYAAVLVGSMLPDLIDKPIGRIIFSGTIDNGRIVAHTLLFFMILCAGAFYMWKRKNDPRFLFLSAASFCHLMEDNMWDTPATLFWPLMGWQFPSSPGPYDGIFGYFQSIFIYAYTPALDYVFISEVTGFVILVFLGVRYLRQKNILYAISRALKP